MTPKQKKIIAALMMVVPVAVSGTGIMIALGAVIYYFLRNPGIPLIFILISLGVFGKKLWDQAIAEEAVQNAQDVHTDS